MKLHHVEKLKPHSGYSREIANEPQETVAVQIGGSILGTILNNIATLILASL